VSYRAKIGRDDAGRAARVVFHREPADTVSTVSRPCGRPSCEHPIPPQKSRRGEPKAYYSDDCRRRHWDETHPRIYPVQEALPLEPEPAPPVNTRRWLLAEFVKVVSIVLAIIAIFILADAYMP
jgi:hypothetical protein